MQLSDKTGIKQNVLQEIIRLAKENDVKKLILFGSRARGDYKERSDIDLAFYGGEFGFSYGKQEAKADDESYLGKSIGEAFGYRVAGVTGFDYFVSKALFISIEIRPIAYDYTVYNIRPQVGLKLLSSDSHGFDFLSNPMLKIGFRF